MTVPDKLPVDMGVPEHVRASLDLVCRYLRIGRSLSEACESPGAPSYDVVLDWCAQYPAVEGLLDSARTLTHRQWVDTLERIGREGFSSPVQVAAAKLHSDNLKWLLEREASAKYGLRAQELTVTIDLRTPLDEAYARLDAMGVFAKPVIDVTPTERLDPEPDVDVDPLSED